MGELARRRRERDLHVSRSHVVAGAIGLVLWSAVCVLGGYLWAQRSLPEPEELAARPSSRDVLADLPAEELDEVLARLEAAAASDGLAELRAGYDKPTASPQTRGAASGPPAEAPDAAEADPMPRGRFTIDLGRFDTQTARSLQAELRDKGLRTWRAPVVAGGQLTMRLALGGFSGEEEAQQELERVSPVLVPLGIEPRVAGLAGP